MLQRLPLGGADHQICFIILCSFALKIPRRFSLSQILSSLLLQLFGPIHSVYLRGELCYLYSQSGYEHRLCHNALPSLGRTNRGILLQFRTFVVIFLTYIDTSLLSV